MTEAQLFTAVIAALNTCLPGYGFTDIDVRQGYQPRVIGAPLVPALLLWNIANKRHGFTAKQDRWDELGQIESHTEKQAREVTLQCNAMVPLPAPSAGVGSSGGSPYSFTAGDLANAAATILASDAALLLLLADGLGIERITDVRQPYTKDEKDQFEASPSFDFTLCFTQTNITQSPTVTTYDTRTERV